MCTPGEVKPDRAIIDPTKKKFVLLKVDGEPPNLPGTWEVWNGSWVELEAFDYDRIKSEEEVQKFLPNEIAQLCV